MYILYMYMHDNIVHIHVNTLKIMLLSQLIDDFRPPTYDYLLGQHILVAPIVTNESKVEVVFPSGSDWVYWWNHSEVYTGGSSHTFVNVPLDELTVFFKNGNCCTTVIAAHVISYNKVKDCKIS